MPAGGENNFLIWLLFSDVTDVHLEMWESLYTLLVLRTRMLFPRVLLWPQDCLLWEVIYSRVSTVFWEQHSQQRSSVMHLSSLCKAWVIFYHLLIVRIKAHVSPLQGKKCQQVKLQILVIQTKCWGSTIYRRLTWPHGQVRTEHFSSHSKYSYRKKKCTYRSVV